MAIAAVSATYIGTGPAKTGQVVLQEAFHGTLSGLKFGTATFTGDGSATTAVLNYIDGTEELAASPTGIIAFVCGGDDTAGATVAKVVDNADKLGATVTFSAAPANTKKVKIAFILIP